MPIPFFVKSCVRLLVMPKLVPLDQFWQKFAKTGLFGPILDFGTQKWSPFAKISPLGGQNLANI